MSSKESYEEAKKGWRDIYVGYSNYLQGGNTEDIGWFGKLYCWLMMKEDKMDDFFSIKVPVFILTIFLIWLFTAMLYVLLLKS